MKILYDISILGRGHYGLRSRTGIHRVVENIAYGLAESEECELHLCASLSLENVNQAIDYLQATQELQHIPFISLGFERQFHKKLASLFLGGKDRLEIPLGFNKLKKSSKKFREFLRYVNRVAKKRIQILSKRDLSTIDLYHSPFHPFPEFTHLSDNTKKIVTIHDLIPIIYPKFYEFGYDSSVKKVIDRLEPKDSIICVSHSTKNDLLNYRKDIEPSRVSVVHLAASELFHPCYDADKIDTVKKKYQIPDAPYLLSLNTLEPRKNIAHTIRCFVRMVEQEKIKDLSLVIVGRQGWCYDDVFDELSKFPSLKGRIVITGYIDDEDMPALYSGATAFVFPSFYEGFGLPPLEAMQCGVPVITSNTSSLPEVVGDAGMMVSPTDTDGLCQNMLEVYKKPALRKELSRKSLEQAKKFSWKKCTQETIRSYKAALGSD